MRRSRQSQALYSDAERRCGAKDTKWNDWRLNWLEEKGILTMRWSNEIGCWEGFLQSGVLGGFQIGMAFKSWLKPWATWSYSWTSFKQEVGLEASWDHFQPELTSDFIILIKNQHKVSSFPPYLFLLRIDPILFTRHQVSSAFILQLRFPTFKAQGMTDNFGKKEVMFLLHFS